jgi:hypothetical protein
VSFTSVFNEGLELMLILALEKVFVPFALLDA